MTQMKSMKSFDDFRDAIYGFRLSRIMMTALDLDLFTIMESRLWTIKELASAVSASERGLDILCRNLASVGLLRKDGARYCSNNLGRTFLNSNGPQYRGAYLDLLCRQWKDWSQLTESVRSGQPVEEPGENDQEYRRSFTWAMHHRSIEAAQQVAKQLKLKSARTLLDVGGGPGTYALEFLKKNPKLEAGVWDRQAALEVAGQIATEQKLDARMSNVEGDFLNDPVPGSFDILWLSNVIHIYSAEENIGLLKKLRKSLRPGGRVLIQDTFLQDKEGLRPLESNLFAVTMLLFTETGNTYSISEVQGWFTTAGFKKTRRLQMKKHTGDWEGVIIEGS